ncbi:unnamed protein product, partial [marine sediment metagenome]
VVSNNPEWLTPIAVELDSHPVDQTGIVNFAADELAPVTPAPRGRRAPMPPSTISEEAWEYGDYMHDRDR